jgi:D-alanyl-D-alanine-carboxypeptidase/D-alanyl-D-alanine-endopeptidase
VHIRPLIALLAIFLVPESASGAGVLSPADAAIREAGRAWLSEADGVGLTIGIFENNQRRFFNFGVSQLDGNKPPTKDTVYEIGGISKTFAGQLLARAIVEGRATAQDQATKYLDEEYPNLVNDGETIRLLHLVNSTSQLYDNIPDLTQVRGVPNEPLAATRIGVIQKYTRAEFLTQLHRVMPRLPPGTAPSPSNVGAMLLGVVLEKIYGESFEAVLAREIERPLRMASGTQPPAKLLAHGYTSANEALPPFGAKIQYASNTLRYSADDLLKFCSWQMVERDASVKLAHQPTWSRPDGRVSLGFFWVLGESAHGRRLIYTGSTYGFASLCDLYPDANVTVVLLANKSAAGAQESLRALSAKIISLLRPATEGGAEVSPPSSADAPLQAR